MSNVTYWLKNSECAEYIFLFTSQNWLMESSHYQRSTTPFLSEFSEIETLKVKNIIRFCRVFNGRQPQCHRGAALWFGGLSRLSRFRRLRTGAGCNMEEEAEYEDRYNGRYGQYWYRRGETPIWLLSPIMYCSNNNIIIIIIYFYTASHHKCP